MESPPAFAPGVRERAAAGQLFDAAFEAQTHPRSCHGDGVTDDLEISPALAKALAARHAAFLAERLTGAAAKSDLRRSLEEAYDDVLARPLREVLDPEHVVRSAERLLTNDALRGFVAPLARAIHGEVLAALRAETSKVGEFVPEDARRALDRLLERSDLVPEALVRQIAMDPATDLVLHDVVYDALVEFNDVVNPFFADWGLPALIKKVMPIGAGTVLKSMALVRGEFDKRLEPEIKKFLLAFFRRSKPKIADLVVAKAKDPAFATLRKNVALFVYEHTLADLLRAVDDAARDAADEATLAVVTTLVADARPRAALRATLEQLVRTHGERPLADLLRGAGVTARPDFDALVDACWPTVALLLASAPARSFYERISTEFYEALSTRS
jgi:hypothetical protein